MHTSWQYSVHPDKPLGLIVDLEGYTVVELLATENTTAASDLRSNARLIAAAPDLLKALQDLTSYFGPDTDNGLDELLTNARAAIAKARA